MDSHAQAPVSCIEVQVRLAPEMRMPIRVHHRLQTDIGLVDDVIADPRRPEAETPKPSRVNPFVGTSELDDSANVLADVHPEAAAHTKRCASRGIADVEQDVSDGICWKQGTNRYV